MKIKLTTVYVVDQERALRFYTEVLGFVKKADFSQGPFRWLTVASSEAPDGTEPQLALNDNPPAKAYQQAMFQQGQPAAMFFTDDVQTDYECMKARGAEFTMPPTDVTGSKIARLNDTCGNRIQVTQLMRWEKGRSALDLLRGSFSEEVPLDWNKWVRQIHRWMSIAFTVTVIANFIALAQAGGMPPPWVTYSPLLPLALLLLTGLYLFVLPYATKWRRGRRAGGAVLE